MRLIFKSMAAGFCIGIGGSLYLIMDSRLTGSLWFALGLLLIVINKFTLFTGEAGYSMEGKAELFHGENILVYLFNAVGAGISSMVVYLSDKTHMGHYVVCNKLDDFTSCGFGRIFASAFLCGVLVFVAVDGFRKMRGTDLTRLFILVFSIAGFVYCGFEHCIADIFFFCCSYLYDMGSSPYGYPFGGWEVTGWLTTVTAGNFLGSLLTACLFKVAGGEEERA